VSRGRAAAIGALNATFDTLAASARERLEATLAEVADAAVSFEDELRKAGKLPVPA